MDSAIEAKHYRDHYDDDCPICNPPEQPTAPEAEAFDVEALNREFLEPLSDRIQYNMLPIYASANEGTAERWQLDCALLLQHMKTALREIERLEDERDDIQMAFDGHCENLNDAFREIERLRAGWQSKATKVADDGRNTWYECIYCGVDVGANGNGDHKPMCVTEPQTEEG